MAETPVKSVKTICPYCGCGCKIEYIVEGNRITKALPVKDDPASQGRPCIKGLVSFEPLAVERLKYPLIRHDKNAPFRRVSWDAAFKFIKEKTRNLRGEDIFFSGSGEFTNEDNYLVQKLARVVFGTNNIDCCARLCHVSTSKAMHDAYGIGAMPAVMNDVLDADCILAVGTNPAYNYPVLFNRIMDAKKRGAKLINIHAMPTATSKFSDIHVNVSYKALTAFIAGLLNAVSDDKKAAKPARNIDGFREMKESIKYITPEYVSKIAGIPSAQFNKIVDEIIASKKFVALHGMGLTQHANGTQNAATLINLCIIKNGKSIPMRGKTNVQGAVDMGCCPDWLPFGGSAHAAKDAWGAGISQKEGKKITECLESAPVKAAYIMGMNPAQSLPDLNEVQKRLGTMFVVYQHHHPSETMKFADVVLPAAMLPEKDGTVTNAERRVRRVRKAVNPPGGKQDWEVICGLAKALDYKKQFRYKSAKEVFEEISRTIPEYAELSWDVVSEKDDCFADKEVGFTKLVSIEGVLYAEREEHDNFPFTLTTTRMQHHFCTGEATRRSMTLMKLAPKPVCKISGMDAKKLGIKTGDAVRIKSEAGEVKIEAEVDDSIPSSMLVAPYHFESALVNKVIPSHRHLDEKTQTPNYKSIRVAVEKVR